MCSLSSDKNQFINNAKLSDNVYKSETLKHYDVTPISVQITISNTYK